MSEESDIIKRLEDFFNQMDDVLDGEWNNGLSDDDWKIFKDVREILQKTKGVEGS